MEETEKVVLAGAINKQVLFHVQWPVKFNDENGISKLLDKKVLKEAFLNISSTIMTGKGEDSKVTGR